MSYGLQLLKQILDDWLLVEACELRFYRALYFPFPHIIRLWHGAEERKRCLAEEKSKNSGAKVCVIVNLVRWVSALPPLTFYPGCSHDQLIHKICEAQSTFEPPRNRKQQAFSVGNLAGIVPCVGDYLRNSMRSVRHKIIRDSIPSLIRFLMHLRNIRSTIRDREWYVALGRADFKSISLHTGSQPTNTYMRW